MVKGNGRGERGGGVPMCITVIFATMLEQSKVLKPRFDLLKSQTESKREFRSKRYKNVRKLLNYYSPAQLGKRGQKVDLRILSVFTENFRQLSLPLQPSSSFQKCKELIYL